MVSITTAANNPAGRLFQILQAVRDGNRGSTPMKEVWAQVLDADKPAEIMYRVSQIIRLVDDSIDALARIPDIDQKLYTEPFEEVKKVLSTLNLEEGWEEFTKRLPNDTVKNLQFGSDVLKASGENVLAQEALEELQADIADVLEKVIAADITEELKNLVIDSLEDIRRAILEYRIRGGAGLREALDRSIGAVVRYREESQKISDPEEAGVFGFSMVLEKLSGLVSTALKLKQLVGQMLPMLTGDADGV